MAAVTAYAADVTGEYTRGAELSVEAMELADRLDDPICLTWAAHTAARHGIAGDGLPYASRAVDVARERALVTALPLALQAQAAGLIAESRFDLAYSTPRRDGGSRATPGSHGLPAGTLRISRQSRRYEEPTSC